MPGRTDSRARLAAPDTMLRARAPTLWRQGAAPTDGALADRRARPGRFAKRISELGGTPDFDPEGLHTRSHAEYTEGKNLNARIREELVAERIEISTYSEIVQ